MVAQGVQALLGRVPLHALAVGLQISGSDVGLHFQLSELSAQDDEDMADVLSELEALVGDEVRIELSHEIRGAQSISPHDGFDWIYLAR